MFRLLLDQNMPKGLASILSAHRAETTYQMGWDRLENGDLLRAAEKAGFDVMITADQNIRYRQNMAGRRIDLVVLSANFLPTIRTDEGAVREAVDEAGVGTYTAVAFDRPPLRRRRFVRDEAP